MHPQDEITPRHQSPRRTIRRGSRRFTGRPSEKKARRIGRIGQEPARVAWTGVTLVPSSRSGGLIDADVGMVDNPRVSGMELDRSNPSRGCCRNRNDEASEHVAAGRPTRTAGGAAPVAGPSIAPSATHCWNSAISPGVSE